MAGILSELFVEVTDKCLFNCLHCSTLASQNGKHEIPFSEIKRLINEGVALGLKCFSISGGEPFLYPDLVPLIRYVKKRNIFLSIYTCGVILESSELIPLPDQLIKELKDDRIDRLIFSIHGLRDNHDYITGTPGSFDLVLTSIKKAVAAGIHVELHFVPMKVNEQDVPQIIELANGIGVYHISFLRLVPQGRCAQNRDLLLDKPSLEKVVAWKYIYEKKLPHMKIRLGAPFNCIHPTVPCSAGENKLLISPNGEVFPCEAFKFLRGRQNTIYKSTLEDLWAKDDLLNQLRTLKHDEGIKDCYDCFRKDTCRGGCPGQHLLHYGHLKYGPDPLCNIEPGGQEDVCFCRQEY